MDDQLPATLPRRRGAIGVLTVPQRLRRRAEDVLAGRGLLEVVGRAAGDDLGRHDVLHVLSVQESVRGHLAAALDLDFQQLDGSASAAVYQQPPVRR